MAMLSRAAGMARSVAGGVLLGTSIYYAMRWEMTRTTEAVSRHLTDLGDELQIARLDASQRPTATQLLASRQARMLDSEVTIASRWNSLLENIAYRITRNTPPQSDALEALVGKARTSMQRTFNNGDKEETAAAEDVAQDAVQEIVKDDVQDAAEVQPEAEGSTTTEEAPVEEPLASAAPVSGEEKAKEEEAPLTAAMEGLDLPTQDT